LIGLALWLMLADRRAYPSDASDEEWADQKFARLYSNAP
jgi:hypothetical protein